MLQKNPYYFNHTIRYILMKRKKCIENNLDLDFFSDISWKNNKTLKNHFSLVQSSQDISEKKYTIQNFPNFFF